MDVKLEDLVGCELMECHFGKAWVRLVFSTLDQDPPRTYRVDTTNHVSDRPIIRHGTSAERVMEDLARGVYASLERKLEAIERIAHGFRFQFASGSVICICYDSDTIDTLVKVTQVETGAWSVFG
jgi:hypothetical protein